MKVPATKKVTTVIKAKRDGVRKTKRRCVRWTGDENQRLIAAVDKFQMKNWTEIAKLVGTKTQDQCNQHWHRVLNPSISKEKWTAEEEQELNSLVKEYGESSWKEISKGLKNRTDLQCRHKWIQLRKEKSALESEIQNQETTQSATHVPPQHTLVPIQGPIHVVPLQQCFYTSYEPQYLHPHDYYHHHGFIIEQPYYYPSLQVRLADESQRHYLAQQQFLPFNFAANPQIDYGCNDIFYDNMYDAQHPSVEELFDPVDSSRLL
ncbi:hypothetical protein AKO1_015261 [Acrasis kona]|uniref:Myb-like DNA-binding domain containing protein n=1 Tax=Acrasis kona TaxID=1008807 RepID=A0AAW2ZF44_9EUKA